MGKAHVARGRASIRCGPKPRRRGCQLSRLRRLSPSSGKNSRRTHTAEGESHAQPYRGRPERHLARRRHSAGRRTGTDLLPLVLGASLSHRAAAARLCASLRHGVPSASQRHVELDAGGRRRRFVRGRSAIAGGHARTAATGAAVPRRVCGLRRPARPDPRGQQPWACGDLRVRRSRVPCRPDRSDRHWYRAERRGNARRCRVPRRRSDRDRGRAFGGRHAHAGGRSQAARFLPGDGACGRYQRRGLGRAGRLPERIPGAGTGQGAVRRVPLCSSRTPGRRGDHARFSLPCDRKNQDRGLRADPVARMGRRLVRRCAVGPRALLRRFDAGGAAGARVHRGRARPEREHREAGRNLAHSSCRRSEANRLGRPGRSGDHRAERRDR